MGPPKGVSVSRRDTRSCLSGWDDVGHLTLVRSLMAPAISGSLPEYLVPPPSVGLWKEPPSHELPRFPIFPRCTMSRRWEILCLFVTGWYGRIRLTINSMFRAPQTLRMCISILVRWTYRLCSPTCQGLARALLPAFLGKSPVRTPLARLGCGARTLLDPPVWASVH